MEFGQADLLRAVGRPAGLLISMARTEHIIEPDAADLAQARAIYRKLIRQSAQGETLPPEASERLARAAKRIGATAAQIGSDILLMQEHDKAADARRELKKAACDLTDATDRLEKLLVKYEIPLAQIDGLREKTMKLSQAIGEKRQIVQAFEAKARGREELFTE